LRHYIKVELLTADGYFSLDVYLPDDDVALEIDGQGPVSSTSFGVNDHKVLRKHGKNDQMTWMTPGLVGRPNHFNITAGGEGVEPGDAASTSTRTVPTVRTELRDMFLARRVNAIASVPWFEWAEMNLEGAAEKKEFVAAKLRAAGVTVPAEA